MANKRFNLTQEEIGDGGCNLENFRKQICDVQTLIDKLIRKRDLGY